MQSLTGPSERPSEAELRDLWQACRIVLDANVLLEIYEREPRTTSELLGVLEELRERIWLPHQAALEYERNRARVVASVDKAFGSASDGLKKVKGTLEQNLRKYNDRVALLNLFSDALENASNALVKARAEAKQQISADTLHARVVELFRGRTGEAYPIGKLLDIYRQAEERFRHGIPPGYADQGKENSSRYGDVLLWFQTIDYARTMEQPIVLVTGDQKPDWIERPEGAPRRVRPELIHEMLHEAGVQLHVCTLKEFLNSGKSYLGTSISEQTLAEVERIEEVRGDPYRLATDRSVAAVAQLLEERYPGSTLRRARDEGFDFILQHPNGATLGAEVMYQWASKADQVGFRIADFLRRREQSLLTESAAQIAIYLSTDDAAASRDFVEAVRPLKGRVPPATVFIGSLSPEEEYIQAAEIAL